MNLLRRFVHALFRHPGHLVPLTVSCFALAGCRLYEFPRYSRPQFSADHPRIRVLMVGNSLTYYNDLPGLLQQLSIHEPAPIYIEKITPPFASLKFQWELGIALQRIREGMEGRKWDVLVLQDFSRKPVSNPKESAEYFARFSEEARNAGIERVILFENWTRRGRENEYAAMESAYRGISKETWAIIAPIGTAWRAIEGERPDIHLFLDDRHPTDAGTYLAAAVLYDVIYHKKAASLPYTLQGSRVEPSVIEVLRKAADDIVDGNP